MNLERLHSPQPLRDADFAAIRARVHGEIASRRERRNGWMHLFRMAFAASLFVMFVPYVRDGVPNVPVEVKPVRIAPVVAVEVARVEPKSAPPPARRRHQPKRDPEAVISRIEIQTQDPDIRIIWIVQPTTKESS